MTLMRLAGRNPGSLLLAAVAGLGVAGCATSVTVDADFPIPLIEPLPVRVGLILDDELQQFEHFEEIPRQTRWTIRLGDANVGLLAPLFARMFLSAERIPESSFAQALQDLDGVIRPTLQVFEFEVPASSTERRDQFVEVWMQYSLELYDSSGDLIIEWPVSGYGRTALGRNREQSLNRAAMIAMRDVGAAISTRFAVQPQVSFWLEEKRNEAAMSVGARRAN